MICKEDWNFLVNTSFLFFSFYFLFFILTFLFLLFYFIRFLYNFFKFLLLDEMWSLFINGHWSFEWVDHPASVFGLFFVLCFWLLFLAFFYKLLYLQTHFGLRTLNYLVLKKCFWLGNMLLDAFMIHNALIWILLTIISNLSLSGNFWSRIISLIDPNLI